MDVKRASMASRFAPWQTANGPHFDLARSLSRGAIHDISPPFAVMAGDSPLGGSALLDRRDCAVIRWSLIVCVTINLFLPSMTNFDTQFIMGTVVPHPNRSPSGFPPMGPGHG
ncbi:MAG: hypothetical protein ABI593_12755 [Betaproteobacteria bacterium]